MLALTSVRWRVVRYSLAVEITCRKALFLESGSVTAVAVHPHQPLFASAHRDGRVRLWHLLDGELVASLETPYPLLTVAFSLNGTLLTAGGHGGDVAVWETDSHQRVATLQWHNRVIQSVAFAPDGSLLALGSGLWDEGSRRYAEGEIAFCHVGDFSLNRWWRAHDAPVNSLAFATEPLRLLSGGWDGVVKVWRTEKAVWASEGSVLERTINAYPTGWLRAFALSPDGALLATVGFNRQPMGSWWEVPVPLWRVADGEKVGVLRAGFFRGHRSPVNAVAFAPNGQLIATGSNDKTVKVWHISGRLLASLEGHVGLVNAIAFSPDSQWLLSGDSNGTILLWRVATE